jgi:hypothetical protein
MLCWALIVVNLTDLACRDDGVTSRMGMQRLGEACPVEV